MAERVSLTPGRSRFVRPSTDFGAGVASSELSTNLERFLDEAGEYLDRETLKRAKKAGAKAGQQGGAKPTGGVSLAERAYDKALLETYYNRVAAETDAKLSSLQSDQEAINDPERMQERIAEVETETLFDVPEQLKPDVQNLMTRRSAKLMNIARNNKHQSNLAQNLAAWNEAESRYQTSILDSAEQGDDDAVIDQMDAYEKRLYAQGPVEMGGTGVLSLQKIQAKRENMRKEVERGYVIGEFKRVSSSEQVAFIQDLAEDKQLREQFTPDEIRGIEDDLYSLMVRERQLEDSQEAEIEAQQERTVEELKKVFIDNPTMENLQTMRPFLNATEYDKYKGMYEGQYEEDNPSVVNELDRAFLRGNLTTEDVFESIGPGGISGETARSYFQDIQSQQKNEFTNWSDWNEMERRLEADYPVARDALGNIMFGGGDARNAERQDRILTRLYEETRTQYQAWTQGEAERPDILNKYRLISNAVAQQEKVDDDQERPEQMKVPKKYRNNPAKIKQDKNMGLISREQASKYLDAIEAQKDE